MIGLSMMLRVSSLALLLVSGRVDVADRPGRLVKTVVAASGGLKPQTEAALEQPHVSVRMGKGRIIGVEQGSRGGPVLLVTTMGIEIRDPETLAVKRTISWLEEGLLPGVYALDPSGVQIAVARSEEIRFIRTADGSTAGTYPMPHSRVERMTFSMDGKMLAAAYRKKNGQDLFAILQPESRTAVILGDGPPMRFAFTPDGKQILGLYGGHELGSWELGKDKNLWRKWVNTLGEGEVPEAHSSRDPQHLSFSDDGRVLYCVAYHKVGHHLLGDEFYAFDRVAKRRIWYIHGRGISGTNAAVRYPFLAYTDDYLADETPRHRSEASLRDLRTGEQLFLTPVAKRSRAALFDRPEVTLAIFSASMVSLYRPGEAVLSQVIDLGPGYRTAHEPMYVAYHAASGHVVALTDQAQLGLFDKQTAARIKTVDLPEHVKHYGNIEGIMLHPTKQRAYVLNGTEILIADLDNNRVTVWKEVEPVLWAVGSQELALIWEADPYLFNLTTEELVKLDLPADDLDIRGLALDETRRRAAVGGENITLFDLARNERIATIEHPDFWETEAARFSPGGEWLAVFLFKYHNIEAGVALFDLSKPGDFREFGAGRIVAFSRDGEWLAIGTKEGVVRLFDVATGKQLVTFQPHTEGIVSLEFTPEGELLTGSWDGTATIVQFPKSWAK